MSRLVIRDKQALRRCVKQAVRRSAVVETALFFDVSDGPVGIEAFDLRAQGTPFDPDAAALLAALDALELPVYDLRRAQEEIATYERGAYLRALLDAMRAEKAFVRVPMDRAGQAFFGDDRFEPLLAVDARAFEAGRYGVNYERAAQDIAGAMRACGATELLAEGEMPEEAVRFALLPLCEDEGFRLHIGLHGAREVRAFGEAMGIFPGARALAWAACGGAVGREAERGLIDLSAGEPRALVRLSSLENLGYALERLGTRFVAFASRARRMELAAGRWLTFKERLYPLLAEAYLPLAKTGYELTDEAVAQDVRRMLGGCLKESTKRGQEAAL